LVSRKCELDPNSLFDERTIIDLTDDGRALKIVETLRDSVEAIPSSAIRTAEELRNDCPEEFEGDFDAVYGGGFGFPQQRDRIYLQCWIEQFNTTWRARDRSRLTFGCTRMRTVGKSI
jgi:hypothetical protein